MAKRIGLAATVAAALLAGMAGGAAATGWPAHAPSAAQWSGPYVGAFAGYGWGRAKATSAFDDNTGFFYNWTGDPYKFDIDGFFGGGVLGHNWQSGGLVVGVEGEVGVLDLRGSAIDPNFQPGTVPIPDTKTKFHSDLYGAVYLRAGTTVGPALVFLKVGVALLDARASTIDPCADGSPQCGTTSLAMRGGKVLVGRSIGAGAEWPLGDRWTARGDYAYFDFGDIATSGPSSVPGEFYRQTIDVTAHTARIGLSRRIGHVAPPPP